MAILLYTWQPATTTLRWLSLFSSMVPMLPLLIIRVGALYISRPSIVTVKSSKYS
ncbi:hypothetical protein M752DRAFT_274715 [Aspergillus phoenicis ATCC 13157]|uniref:Uncharacterized protein n=1 Tax=Aspergillus phoenicis ATCC 13157 TaxID=1353007 RepID=A0A370PR40_ASPPH|nr:hypothetical protein M752DRAFT_274715 [Aspergillus phoenicis ATCC 13157]